MFCFPLSLWDELDASRDVFCSSPGEKEEEKEEVHCHPIANIGSNIKSEEEEESSVTKEIHHATTYAAAPTTQSVNEANCRRRRRQAPPTQNNSAAVNGTFRSTAPTTIMADPTKAAAAGRHAVTPFSDPIQNQALRP